MAQWGILRRAGIGTLFNPGHGGQNEAEVGELADSLGKGTIPCKDSYSMDLNNLLLRRRSRLSRFPGSPYNRAVRTILMHIPKTSGVALTSGLSRALTPARTVSGFDRVLFGSFRAFDTFSPNERSRVYVDAPFDLPADADFVSGHMALATLLERYEPANYLTVLREPMSRILSHWLFWRAVPDDYLAQVGAWAENISQARKPLVDFLSCKSVACQVDNISVRMLLWPHQLIPDGDFIDPRNDNSLVNEAITRLRRFSFVDVIENPRMLANLQTWLGRPVTYQLINATTSIPLHLRRPLHEELTAEAADIIETRTRLDIKLWATLANDRIIGVDACQLRRWTVAKNVARLAYLMVA